MAFSNQQWIQIQQKYGAIAKTSRGEQIRKMLESHPSIASAVGKRWLTGLVYNSVTSIISSLTHWYLWFEDQKGQEAATEALNRYLGRETVKNTLCIWVFGTKRSQTKTVKASARPCPSNSTWS